MGALATNTIEAQYRDQLESYGTNLDPVTGLVNRVYFRSWIRQALLQADQLGQQVALVWIDVLNLRREYLIAGEHGAQGLMQTITEALRPWMEEGELTCRFTDRSFLLALKVNSSLDARVNSILDAASHRTLRAAEGKPEIAAGITYYPDHSSSPDELVRFASLAADAASRTRSRTATLFQPAMNTAIQLERDLEKDLRLALRENQLTLVYQPQIDLRTGNILGVEGLTRWHHPTRGHVSPAQFIPVAERSDMIDEIFSHSLRQLLRDVSDWRRAGFVPPSAAVNASPANVRHEDFLSIVKRELALLPPGETQLDIEVTESLLIDDEELFVERLAQLRSIGVKVSLDDFGTRYTGFNALKGLPLNTMKIDRCFVHGVDRSAQAQSLCRTIVTMASHLELSTIAEGIEEIGELRTLKKLGCLGGQGYLFQRPVKSDRFLDFVRQWPARKKCSEFHEAFQDVEVDPQYEVDPLYGVMQ